MIITEKMQIQKHIDGTWMTSTYVYKDRKVLIKSRKTKGIKCHVFYPNSEKVEFTLRYSFSLPENILKKVKIKIDSNNLIQPIEQMLERKEEQT